MPETPKPEPQTPQPVARDLPPPKPDPRKPIFRDYAMI